jgi:hypothetical protein
MPYSTPTSGAAGGKDSAAEQLQKAGKARRLQNNSSISGMLRLMLAFLEKG